MLPSTGDLEGGFHFGGGNAAKAGIEIHGIIQREYKKSKTEFEAEMALSRELSSYGLSLQLSGRLDCLYKEEGEVVIEEIKSGLSAESLFNKVKENEEHSYRKQLLLYGYLYYLEKGVVPKLKFLFVSRYNLADRITFELEFDPKEFERTFESWMLELQQVLKDIEDNISLRQKKADLLEFPFDTVRSQQEEIFNFCEGIYEDKGSGIIQAPTGTGKTAAVLFPLLKKSMVDGRQVFYATSRNTQHQLPVEFLKKLKEKLNSVTIYSREKICMKESVNCDPAVCEYARGYYDKLNKHKLLKTKGNQQFDELKSLAQEYEVCPFELSLDLGLRADVVIGDYNYVFSPGASLKRFLSSIFNKKLKPVIAVDEFHHFYSRNNDYYGLEFSSKFIKSLKVPKGYISIAKRLYRFIESDSHKPTGSFRGSSEEIEIKLSNLKKILKDLSAKIIRDSELFGLPAKDDPGVELYNLISTFIENASEPLPLVYIRNKFEKSIDQVCLDASSKMPEILEAVHCLVGFSATCTPFEFYKNASGISKAKELEVSSAFSPSNRKVMIIPQVDTRYHSREKMIPKVAQVINKVHPIIDGKSAVFFSSFDMLNKVIQNIDYNDLYIQERNMTLSDQERLLKNFKQSEKGLLVAVSGGVFSEGIDLPGDQLKAAVIVGPALPFFDLINEKRREYFEDKYNKGMDYTYIIPGMTKVVQAAGRVIRTIDDTGVIILLGQRFTEPEFSRNMPDDWFVDSPLELCSQSILKDIEEFWNA